MLKKPTCNFCIFRQADIMHQINFVPSQNLRPDWITLNNPQMTGTMYGKHAFMNKVPQKPLRRQWITLKELQGTLATFLLMSYNVLCDMYITPKMRRNCPSDVLDSNRRKQVTTTLPCIAYLKLHNILISLGRIG